MMRMDDESWRPTPIPGRRLSDITDQRKFQLSRVLAAFGLEPDPMIWVRLNRAFIHRSYRTEAGLDEDNERLEFLGDSVIGLVCTESILRLYQDSDEGWLSKLRAAIVSRAILGQIALDMKLGQLLLLGAGEERSGGRNRVSLLGSTLEAVCGVLFLHYPWTEIREPIRRAILLPALELARMNHIADYKSKLQELTQKTHQQIPEYRLLNEGGPDHEKSFTVQVWLANRMLGQGSGARKKLAENDAAKAALDFLASA